MRWDIALAASIPSVVILIGIVADVKRFSGLRRKIGGIRADILNLRTQTHADIQDLLSVIDGK